MLNKMVKNTKTSKRTASIKTARLIALGFVLVILAGSLLLKLPVASADGRSIPYIDALFTATTSTCVTGLVTTVTAVQWSLFGQVVILCLIQIGGLGVVSVVTLTAILLGSKISIKGRTIIQKSMGLDSLSGIVKFILLVLKGTFIVELLGAACYSLVFIPEFGIGKGLWCSVFTSVSAFCNAGIDIIGENSLQAYVNHPLINIVTICLIVLAGLGFPVWDDVLHNITSVFKKKQTASRFFLRLSLHSKIVLSSTMVLIVFGAFFISLLEWNHAFRDLNPLSKIMAGFFQSVTIRTAGFFTVDQALLSNAALIFCLPLMLIGGSPAGCAGGVKITTIVLLLGTVRSVIREKRDVEIFGRRLSSNNIGTAISVLLMYFVSLMVMTVVFLAVEPQISFADGIFETVSAMATVGLSRGITANLSVAGKLVLIILMFIGRTGPITVALSLKDSNADANMLRLPEEEVMIG